MIISIDGASRRNGRPDCVAAGGIFYEKMGTFGVAASHKTQATNQQGELLGLITALHVAKEHVPMNETIYIITDSEYVYNAVSKDWVGSWESKGWKTAGGDPVKSQELWQEIKSGLEHHYSVGNEIMIYHIKGHLVSIGKVGAANSLSSDGTGRDLLGMAWKKYSLAVLKNADKFDSAQELFERNHGYKLPADMFKKFVCFNTVADYVAGTYLDKIEAGGLAQ